MALLKKAAEAVNERSRAPLESGNLIRVKQNVGVSSR